MKKIILVYLFISYFWVFTYAQSRELSLEEAKSSYYTLNREVKVTHTPIPVFTNGVKTTRMSLSGNWLFSSKPDADFEKGDFNKQAWSSIKVPAEWNMEGFMVEDDTWAGYYREFKLPSDWKDKHVKIKFGAVQSQCKVFVNGKYVGAHEGAMTAFEMDLTDFIQIDKVNSIALYVKSNSLSESSARISHYAKHQVGGILREVVLLVYSPLHISSLICDALLDSTLQQGTLNLNIELNKKRAKNSHFMVRLKERGIEGLFSSAKVVLEKRTKEQSLSLVVQNPQLWHAESPFLYALEVDVYSNGIKQETICRNIGFKRVEIRTNSLYVNNRQVKLRGVARHDISPYEGRAVPDSAYLWRDVQLLLKGNCNFVRTSHYPADEYFMDLCDRYGIFVEDEAPVCWEKHQNTADYTKSLFYAFKSLLYRDRSHPSVLTWSIANESIWGARFYPCYLLAKDLTPHFPVKFSHSEFKGILKMFDIGAKHYPGWRGVLSHQNYFRPMIFSEALHVNCYNTTENITDPGLRDLWGDCIHSFVNTMQEAPAIAGLGIWSGIDEMFYPKNGEPCGYGPWGIWDGFRREKPEYWHMKMAYSPIVVTSKHFMEDNQSTCIAIENRYNFTTTEKVAMHWTDGHNSGVAHCIIQPGEEGLLRIPELLKGDTLELTAKDARGFDIACWKLPRKYSPHFPMPYLTKENEVTMHVDAEEYVIQTNNLVYHFSKNDGQLKHVYRDGADMFKGAMNGYLIPLQKENETIDFIPVDSDNKDTRFASDPLDEWIFEDIQAEETDYGVKLTVHGYYGTVKTEYVYNIDGSNRLKVDYMFNLSNLKKEEKDIRQYGVGFDLPAAYQNLSWRRKGLWTIYPTDHIGRNEGVAKAFYPETLTNYYATREIPQHSYNKDGNKYGSNDFRSTKHNIIKASLYTDDNKMITIESNGCQHIRAWVNGDKISFLVAHHSNGGNEHYLNYDSDQKRSLNFAIHNNDIAGWIQLYF